MMEKFPAVEWAVVSAVLEQQLNHSRLKEFFFWLVSNLNTYSEAHGGLKFALNPSKVIITANHNQADVVGSEEGDTEHGNHPKKRTWTAYKTIRRDFPNVIVIFHVLPGPNSEEYEWMKLFATEFGFARQGIQKENVLTNFQSTGADLDQIYKNMISWCEKSLEILAVGAHGQAGSIRSCTLFVTVPGDIGDESRSVTEEVSHAPFHSPLPDERDLQDSVLWCLHGVRPLSPPPQPHDEGQEFKRPPEFAFQKSRGCGMGSITSTETAHEFTHETDVLIQGLPEKLTQYEVACIFWQFRVKGLRLGLDARSAYVRLGSRFEAIQAVESLDTTLIHESFQVSVEPCNPEVKMEMKKSIAEPVTVSKPRSRARFQSGGNQ